VESHFSKSARSGAPCGLAGYTKIKIKINVKGSGEECPLYAAMTGIVGGLLILLGADN